MSVRQNLRFALRTLRRNPTFAVTAVGTLALGVSVNTTIFSVVNAVLLQPLPYPDAGRLVLLWTTNPQKNAFERSTGYLNVQDWRNTQSFDAMAYFRNEPMVLREGQNRNRSMLLSCRPISSRCSGFGLCSAARLPIVRQSAANR
jgi:putative ABC transport system permease protein